MAYPDAPLNVFCIHPFIIGHLDIRWDDSRYLSANQNNTIVGYNIYRSYDTPNGPYTKLNPTPIGALFYRDSHRLEHVINEIPITGSTPTGEFYICTQTRPILKPIANTTYNNTYNVLSILANAPEDVEVTVNGQSHLVYSVDGFTGEIVLDTSTYYKPCVGGYVSRAVIAGDDLRVSYYRTANTVITRLNQRVYYKVTSVDSDGNETPLANTVPVTYQEEDKLDYIWREALRRSSWLLDQGGEHVKLFIRKAVGATCKHYNNFYKQSTVDTCLICYGTNIVGGYEGPYDVIIAPPDQNKSMDWTDLGLVVKQTFSTWTLPMPMLSQRDFFVKPNGERFTIGAVNQVTVRGSPLLQFFDVNNRQEKDIIYKVPINGSENTPANLDADPQITPVDPEIPVGQQLKGRTKVYGNINN